MAKSGSRGRKVAVPKRIAEAPRLLQGLDLFWRAYWQLTTDRPPDVVRGSGDRRQVLVQFIPWASVRAWAVATALDEEATEALHYHVTRMDIAYMAAKGHISGHAQPQPEQVDGNSR